MMKIGTTKNERLASVALAAIALVVAGCGGAGDAATSPGTGAENGEITTGAATVGEQPPDGVPAGTFPLPLPVKGQAYDNPQPRDNIRDGGTLTMPIGELGPNFNIFSVDGNTNFLRHVMNWISPRLWDYTVTGEASPNTDYLLSAEVISESPETVKFTLNPAAKWNDGTPIDWTAFETTWRTQRGGDERFNPAITAGYSAIDGVRKGERDNEVIVTFAEPTYPIEYLFNFLAHPRNIDSELFRTGWINDLHPEMLAGPFAVESLEPGRVVLVRNPKWWGDPPKLERVIYRQMDDIASINAFQNGEVDTTTVTGGRATADLLKQIGGMQNVQIRRGFNTTTAVYTTGQDSDLFKDEAARRAFVLGTDRARLVEIRYQGMSWQEEAPGSAIMYPWQDGYRDNLADLRYDPERARTVLDQAGWRVGDDGLRYRDGKVARFTYVMFGDDPTLIAVARAQQKMAREIGLDMQIDVRRTSDFSKTLTEGTYDVVAMSWAAADPFGHAQACQIYCVDSESNFSGLGNDLIDKAMTSVGTVRDQAQALAAFNEAEASALQQIGTFPIYNGPSQFAVKKGLANFGPAGFLIPAAEDVGWQK
jgi:peptide/nickel transport system substrate-binding protein